MDRDQQVRERAYALWEDAGRPDHRQDEFWDRAQHDIDNLQQTVDLSQPIDLPVDGVAVALAPFEQPKQFAEPRARAERPAKPVRSVAAKVSVSRRSARKKTE
jgi:hypothetical protein